MTPVKGTRYRKTDHLVGAEKLLAVNPKTNDNLIKTLEIVKMWSEGHSVSILQLGLDTNHYEACANEFAALQAIGLQNLTNKNNCMPYGAMKYVWNCIETLNFGKMLLHNALLQAIFDRPEVYEQGDIFFTK